MTDFQTRFDRLWSGQDSTHSQEHHPFAHLDMLEEVADGVAFYKAFVNVSVVNTDDGAVLIDTGAHAPIFQEPAFKAVRGWTSKHIHTAIYTHGHADHAYGLPPYLQEAADNGWSRPRIIGHECVGERMQRYVETNGYNAVINTRQFGIPILWPMEYILPTDTYASSLNIEVGGTRFELSHARGETDDATWVFLPDRKVLFTGDLFIWASPNAGNPQKVQRYCIEWARALRKMAAKEPELLLPGHGVPVFGADKVQTVLLDTAKYLETIYEQTLALLNQGATIYDIIESIQIPTALTEQPFLQPVYDEPEFVARNIYRCLAGWYSGIPSELKPASPNQQALVIAELAGGVEQLLTRADALLEAGDVRMACHLVDWSLEVSPDSKEVHELRARVYAKRSEVEPSTMSRGIFNAAQRESAEHGDNGNNSN